MPPPIVEPYAARPVRFLELWEPPGWRIKIYGIASGAEQPAAELVAAAKGVAWERLRETASQQAHYGVGFLGIHEGRGANFVFIDWWADENELHHHVSISTSEEPAMLRATTAADPIACAWDVAVLAFEREAWVETVLKNPNRPDLEAYVRKRMTGMV